MDFNEIQPYGLRQLEKERLLLSELSRLVKWHQGSCTEYKKLLTALDFSSADFQSLESLPFLPVRLFKHHDLLSIPPGEVVKTMVSSGTTGQNVSRIFLDKQTSGLQVKILSKIVSEFIGPKRLPMLIIDCKATVADRYKFSARTAGILGFSIFGRDVEYALNDDMSLDLDRVTAFIQKYQGEKILIFGFTFIVWKHLVLQLESLQTNLDLQNSILIHGGGWKQMLSESVGNPEFKERLQSMCGLSKVHNFYGMVEQTGSIFMECEMGNLHTSAFSDVLFRNPVDFSVLGNGVPGLIQLLSVIPHSYPGHSLLSEDIGELGGTDDCPCGRGGKHFKVHGRIQNAEVRGCSDTYSR